MGRLQYILLATFVLCSFTNASPLSRLRREAETEHLDPIDEEDGTIDENDRDKRGSPEAILGPKNAILGFVFGKLNDFIDSKTRWIDKLDQSNIEKNKQAGIESPKPITGFQDIFSSAIGPKISSITSKFGSLSSTFLGGSGASSSGSLSGSKGDSGSSSGSSGFGNILSSVLRLSGPLLSSSSGGKTGGGGSGGGGLISVLGAGFGLTGGSIGADGETGNTLSFSEEDDDES